MLPRPPTLTLFPYTTLFRSAPLPAESDEDNPAAAFRLDPHEAREAKDGELRPATKKAIAQFVGTISRIGQAIEDGHGRSEEHTSELQSHVNLVCRLLLEKKK